MVRRRVEIKPILDKAKRHTTFTKRRQGLFKKATALCNKYAAEAMILAFSKAGNLYCFGNPSIEPVLSRYYSASLRGECSERAHGGEITEENDMTDVEKRITEAVGNGPPAWEEAAGNLELNKLDELEEAIENIKSQVAMRARQIEATGERNPEGEVAMRARETKATGERSPEGEAARRVREIEASGERNPEGELSGAERV